MLRITGKFKPTGIIRISSYTGWETLSLAWDQQYETWDTWA
jgi:hypothetical protein